jgi:hypothetical protein
MFRTDNADFAAVLAQICEHLAVKGCVESTQITYSRSLHDLMIATQKVPLNITEPEIVTHLSDLRDKRARLYWSYFGKKSPPTHYLSV